MINDNEKKELVRAFITSNERNNFSDERKKHSDALFFRLVDNEIRLVAY